MDAGAIASIIGAVGSLVGGAGSAFGSNGKTSVYKTAKLMKQNEKVQKRYATWYLENITKPTTNYYAKNLYSLERAGLIKAGYNPMLAYMNNINAPLNSSGGVSSSGTANEGTNASAIAQAGSTIAGLSSMPSQIQNVKANTNLQNEQAETEKAKRVQMDFQNAMSDVERHLREKDLSTYDRRFYANLYEQMQRAENYRAQTDVTAYNAQTARMNAQASMKDAETRRGTYSTSAGFGGISSTGYMSEDERRQFYRGGYKPKSSKYNGPSYSNDRNYWRGFGY